MNKEQLATQTGVMKEINKLFDAHMLSPAERLNILRAGISAHIIHFTNPALRFVAVAAIVVAIEKDCLDD